MFKATVYFAPDISVSEEFDTWEDADKYLDNQILPFESQATGGKIDVMIEGAGWVLCNENPDEE